jgi:hypothetical protein
VLRDGPGLGGPCRTARYLHPLTTGDSPMVARSCSVRDRRRRFLTVRSPLEIIEEDEVDYGQIKVVFVLRPNLGEEYQAIGCANTQEWSRELRNESAWGLTQLPTH